MARVMAVVLAAGEGKRMHSRLPKVLHPLCGKRMLEYILESAAELAQQVLVVVGHGAFQVRETMGKRWTYVLQAQQLGTGHAVMEALKELPREGTLLVLCGDTPLLEAAHLKKLLDYYRGHAAAVATAIVPDPAGYGRIVRNQKGQVQKIVEDRDASAGEKEISEINTGTYCFDLELLRYYLPRLSTDNAQNEYYLPDLVAMMHRDGYSTGAYCLDDYRVGLGINNRAQLAEAVAILQRKIKEKFMKSGVTFEDPDSVFIDMDVRIGADTVIRPGCVIENKTVIGDECLIGPGTHLNNASIGNQATVYHSVIYSASIKGGSEIGPFAHVRGGGDS